MVARKIQINACAVLCSIGFGLTLSWCMLTSHSDGFIYSTLGVDIIINPRIFYLLGIFVLALAYVAIPRLLKQADGALRFVMPLFTAFGTACYAISYHQTFFDAAVLAIMGLFLIGVGYFWFLSRYVLLLARTQKISCAVWAIFGGLVFKLPVMPTFALIGIPEFQVMVAIVLPVVSAVVFELACSAARKQAQRQSIDGDAPIASNQRTIYGVPTKPRTETPTSKTFRRNSLILMSVIAIMLAVIRSVSMLGLWGRANVGEVLSLPSITSILVTALFLALFAHFVLNRMSHFTLAMRFQPAMLILLAGFFIVVLQASPANASMPLLTEIIQVDELCTHLLYWTVIITALDALNMPSYRVIGIAEVFFSLASIAWMLFLGEAAVYDNVFVLLAVYIIVIGAMYATWQGGKRQSRDGDSVDERFFSESPEGSLSDKDGALLENNEVQANSFLFTKVIVDACLPVAKRYGLSPRETEVFILLMQGRTQSFIQDELTLAGSTVKTHVSHIYAKMDVHDRQEMMDLVWQADAGIN